VSRGVRLAENRKGGSRLVIMAWPLVFWFLMSWDFLSHNDKTKENWGPSGSVTSYMCYKGEVITTGISWSS
jgi:hypothetical protein